MKKILSLIVLSYALITSCHKSNTGQQGGPGTLARMQDSSGTFYFYYTGDKITSAIKHDLQGHPAGSMTFEYPDHLVKITDHVNNANNIIHIFLNDYSLPVSMHRQWTDRGEDTVLFLYKPGTLHLDSVFSFEHISNGAHPVTYAFRYDGDNISRVIVRNGSFIDSVMLTYKPNTSNPFKTSAPLFFIYSDLTYFGPLNNGIDPYMYKAFFFARLLSAGTLDSYTYTYAGRTGAGQFQLTTLGDKVTEEFYPTPHPQNYFYN